MADPQVGGLPGQSLWSTELESGAQRWTEGGEPHSFRPASIQAMRPAPSESPWKTIRVWSKKNWIWRKRGLKKAFSIFQPIRVISVGVQGVALHRRWRRRLWIGGQRPPPHFSVRSRWLGWRGQARPGGRCKRAPKVGGTTSIATGRRGARRRLGLAEEAADGAAQAGKGAHGGQEAGKIGLGPFGARAWAWRPRRWGTPRCTRSHLASVGAISHAPMFPPAPSSPGPQEHPYSRLLAQKNWQSERRLHHDSHHKHGTPHTLCCTHHSSMRTTHVCSPPPHAQLL